MSLPGRLLYQMWHRPLARISQCRASGGLWEEYRTEQGRRRMEKAARKMKAMPGTGKDGTALHLLTGRRFWYQTVFCLASWIQAAGKVPAIVLYDDGSLEAGQRDRLLGIFPSASILSCEEIRSRLDQFLPERQYPRLRERWQHYPNIRKLTDVHAGSRGWKLVLDSDLLFFRQPAFLLDWLAAPDRPLHAVDCEESYGYSRPLMESLAGAPLPEKLNVGLCGLQSETIDWDRLEFWTGKLIDQENTHYYLEQALTAMLVAGQACAAAPAGDYVTYPRAPEALACQAVMHHYVAGSKRWYFRQNWEKIAPRL